MRQQLKAMPTLSAASVGLHIDDGADSNCDVVECRSRVQQWAGRDQRHGESDALVSSCSRAGPCASTTQPRYTLSAPPKLCASSNRLNSSVGVCLYTASSASKAKPWLEKAAAQNLADADYMLGVYYEKTDPLLSELHFERARKGVWSSPPKPRSVLESLTASQHFAKWHYLNYHQRITDHFRDSGRQQALSGRETIVVAESDPALQICVFGARQFLRLISGRLLSPDLRLSQADM
jgi:hypothetical protein